MNNDNTHKFIPTKISSNLSETYDEKFFSDHLKNNQSYEKLSEYLKTKTNSITEFGCGHGLLVENLIKIGVDAYGLECSESAKSM